MKTPNYIFTPNRHKIILSASPFIIALTHTFFRMGGAQSGIIPSLITNILLGTSVIIGSLLELPFKPLFFLIAISNLGTTVIYDLTYYFIILIYSLVIYVLLSLAEARKNTTPIGHKRTIRSGVSNIILSLIPMLLPLSSTFVDVIIKIDPQPLPKIIEYAGTIALSIVIFVGYTATPPLENLLTPLGLWDDMTGIPTHAGLYVTGILYSVLFYLALSLLGAVLRKKW